MAKRSVPPGTKCYLCGRTIDGDQSWNRDHHPPKQFFAPSLRPGVNMKWLYTHNSCNSSFKLDEEYFIASMPIQARDSWTAEPVFQHFGEGVREGRWRSLFDRVRGQFGRVHSPTGLVPFYAEFDRLHRVAWKLARGSYFDQLQTVLPDDTLRTIEIVLPQQASEVLPRHPWYAFVRDTEPLSHVAAVFDLKMLRPQEDGMKLGLMAMLIWNRITILVAFHDLVCACERCCAENLEP